VAGPFALPVVGPSAPAPESPLRVAMGEPYRFFFPLGVVFALYGTLPWTLFALGRSPYPGLLHRSSMIQGFELSFVAGFLLTAIPAFTHAGKCRPWELVTALALMLGFVAAAAAGAWAFAHAATTLLLLHLALAAARRIRGAKLAPPEEFAFVGLGLVLGIAGGVLQTGTALGAWQEPAPFFGARLLSLGTVLSLVLGLGGLLVPAFAGIRDPLVIPGIAGPHERPGRRRLYGVLAALLLLAFAAEAIGEPRLGAITRAIPATVLGLLVWKLHRRPGRAGRFPWLLWSSGWLVLAGLWGAALLPERFTVAALHLTFIGGFGLLTLGIATRVVVGHGRYPMSDEERVLSWAVVGAAALAVAVRFAGEPLGQRFLWLGAAALLWTVAWLGWAAGAFPRILRKCASHPASVAERTSPAPPNLPLR
jgi:uncharacterized protein involved in response to NO